MALLIIHFIKAIFLWVLGDIGGDTLGFAIAENSFGNEFLLGIKRAPPARFVQ